MFLIAVINKKALFEVRPSDEWCSSSLFFIHERIKRITYKNGNKITEFAIPDKLNSDKQSKHFL